ncbi:serine/threonine protein kinase [Neobacillus niacini]|uniref:serine/threonine-protein kinase n=1 Tax=Neobacillus driksii TaxID=3035913 RepID=UPI00278B37CE|nr:serine/threonine-protein kinase [Neobacillus niacini]MDQ0976801.1 serine/threonine protein kinase [Neobacillus niacini]
MIEIGSVIDERYEILKEIGRGGMSIVYLAMDNRLNKSLVVKDIRKRASSNNELLINSLIVEANMLKVLDHGALPKIYDIIESEGDIYVVMDYIEGESLKEKLKREKTISAIQVIDWARQLSEVLEYLHTRKPYPIIYRDMKPDNIMLTPEGKIKLIDFGIAREFKTESSTDTTNLGTKSYAAPEQMSGKQTDTRTDIYSLGVTLYHLVTGKSLNEPPFELKPIRHWDPTLPEGLEHIINKATQAEPANRYQSCSELSYDLENINKLTEGYKNKLRKKLSIFLVPVVLCLAFMTTTVFGYKGVKNTQFQDYMSLVNDSSVYLMDGEDKKAIEMLEKAITTVDKSRAEAYINLLDLYSNRNETDTGLAKIEAYIEDEYGDIHENDEVRFKMGMTYFDIKRNYSEALKHFNQVDPEVIPDAQYYQALSTTMISMNIDYKKFSESLLEFEKFNDQLPNERKKVDNYNSLANIYISYKGQISDANTKAIEIVEKAYEVLRLVENENLLIKYELDFEQKLAQAFYSRGVNSKDKESAKQDYENAIQHYQNLLDLNASNEEEIVVKIGVIYQEMGEPTRAVEQFQNAIKKYPESIDAYVKLGNLLLDTEQSKDDGSRNYQAAEQVYEQVKTLDGAGEDEAFKKLVRRFDNLGIK